MANRRDFLKMGAGLAATTLATNANPALAFPAGAFPPVSAAGSKPNIILILADDMGFSDLGCFGSEVSTPNLDRLAARGCRVNQFYNNPRCCPSRASIMTGLWSQQAGMGMMVSDYDRYPYPGYAGILNPQTITIPEALKSAGYQTAMVGKWHLAPVAPVGKPQWPLQRGFDKFWGMVAGASVYYESPWLMEGNNKLPPPPKDQYLTDLWAEHATNYVKEMSQNKAPYFLYAAFNAPHWPIQAPEELVQKYADRYAVGWDQIRDGRHKKQIDMGLVNAAWQLTPRDPRVPAWTSAKDKKWEMRRMAVYAAMIERLDAGIGRILDAVEASGRADNTLIVFMSDNGGNAEEIGHGNKHAGNGGKASGAGGEGSPMLADGPCQQGYECAGNVPGVMPGGENTFQSIGIPWGNCANTPFRLYKHYTQEGGISSPFIACWPAVIKPTGKPINAVGHETDLMPTFLEISGAKYPAQVAAGPIPHFVGQSMVPIFTGAPIGTHSPIFWEHEGNKAVRDGKWKLVSRFPDQWELYDMEADRTELHDLAQAQPDRTKAMSEQWVAWGNAIGVKPWPMPQTPKGEGSGKMGTPPYLQD